MIDLDDIKSVECEPQPKEIPDMCSCSCGWEGKIEDTETEEDQDGWETPSYLVHVCPNCNYGYIDNYWRSDG